MTQLDAGLLKNVLDNPAEDFPRLVAADWWEEHGETERADLIRLQIEIARLPPRHQLTGQTVILAHGERYWETGAGEISFKVKVGDRVDVMEPRRLNDPIDRKKRKPMLGLRVSKVQNDGAFKDLILVEDEKSGPDPLPEMQRREIQMLATLPLLLGESPGINAVARWSDAVKASSPRTVTATAIFRRGFVAEFVGQLGHWYPIKCESCNGIGFHRLRREKQMVCHSCYNKGSSLGVGPAMVRMHPVETVTIVDRLSWGWGWFTEGASVPAGREDCIIPRDIWEICERLAQRRTDLTGIEDGIAERRLSAALIEWAKGVSLEQSRSE